MIKNSVITFAIMIHLVSNFSFAQDTQKQNSKYVRSSLYTLMIDEPNRKMADTIRLSFNKALIPDKFNDHNLPQRTINYGIIANIDAQEGISKYLAEQKVAQKLVAKWFNRNPNTGAFDMNLISERGFYNASDLDVKKALASKRGMATIADAGEELIKNTFVMVNDFSYIDKEEVGQGVSTGLLVAGSLMSAATGKKEYEQLGTAAAVGTAIMSKGYVVKNKVYLYQLVWNDSVAAVFYNDLWMDNNSIDPKRKAAFENSNLFSLQFIGTSNSLADVQSTIMTSKSNEELIAEATARSIDAGITKLQKKYETFRTKTPLYSTDPVSAKIGLKEGVRKQERYFVYERTTNKDGRIVYKKYATLRVKNKYIWDNRFVATGQSAQDTELTRFYQTKGKKLYPGLLIKQKPDPGLLKPSWILLGQISRLFY